MAATGYENQQEVVRLYLGDEATARIGPLWGHDAGGEDRNMWRRTAQPGPWFTAGGLPHVRIYSKCLALRIEATELRLLNVDVTSLVLPQPMPWPPETWSKRSANKGVSAKNYTVNENI